MIAGLEGLAFTIYSNGVAEPGREAAGVVLLGLIGSFGFIRMSTRLARSPRAPWWPGSVSAGGVHVHHLVFGILLLLIVGFLSFALDPEGAPLYVLAGLFGVGAGLTLDEFALWLYLDDVYWAEQGRRSIDAVVLATLLAGLLLVASPLDFTGEGEPLALVLTVAALVLAACSVALLKGKIVFGLVGLFVPLVALLAAVRLARPDSPWARWRYRANERKLAAARHREDRWSERRARWQDLIGGAPDRPSSG